MQTLNTQEIAQLLGVKQKTVTDKIVKHPDFPTPTVDLSQKVRRWAKDEVLAYVKSARRSARGSRDSKRPGAVEDPGAH